MELFEETELFRKTSKLENENRKLLMDRKVYRRFLDKQYNRVSSIDELLGKLPEKNEQIRIITQKSFNAFAILLYIAEKVNIEELILGVFRIDKNSVTGIKELYESMNIKQITIILSSFFIQTKKPERSAQMLIEFAKGKENIKIVFCWNHTKIMGVKTNDDRYYIIEGSGNMTDNAKIEQYLFEQSKEMFYFHKSWMEELLKMSSNNEIIIY